MLAGRGAPMSLVPLEWPGWESWPGCGGDQRHRLQPYADSPRGEWPFLLTSEVLGTEPGSLVEEKRPSDDA